MQFKIFTILIIFEDSRTSQKLKIEKKSKKVITTKTIKIKAIKIKIREKKATCKRAQKQIKKKYTIFLDKNKSNQILNNIAINSKNITLFKLSKLLNFTKLVNLTKLIICNTTNCFYNKVINYKKKL